MKKILVVAVHPDDETLGCGGTLLRHKKMGDEINWLIITEAKIEHGASKQEIDMRNDEIDMISKLYGFKTTINLKLATMHIDEFNMSDLISLISKTINTIKPTIVYLPFKNDAHSDHRKIFEASYSCTKSFRYPFVKKVYMMETISETEFAPSVTETSFIPNVFIDISEFMEKKLEIMRLYKSELEQHPFPRSEDNIKALATMRGAMAGCKYAESFMLLKEIQSEIIIR